ncbi:hypothetical protein [Chryseobacterium sp. GP-SGM7]|uniref:hypothetical protein n=1 Tax=Chryseobacterium sp. GP-SGM7 TaxID=3411323 RepID=UPI003B95AEF5
MKKNIHFKALINYYSIENGGLTSPISSGYRSSVKFPFELTPYIAVQEFHHSELIFPGDSAVIEVTLIGAEKFLEKLYNGMDFELEDNSGNIANGVITELYF